MSQSSPEGIILSKGSKLISLDLSINKEKVMVIKQETLETPLETPLEQAIFLLKQTTEYDVLQSFRDKVKKLEKEIKGKVS